MPNKRKMLTQMIDNVLNDFLTLLGNKDEKENSIDHNKVIENLYVIGDTNYVSGLDTTYTINNESTRAVEAKSYIIDQLKIDDIKYTQLLNEVDGVFNKLKPYHEISYLLKPEDYVIATELQIQKFIKIRHFSSDNKVWLTNQNYQFFIKLKRLIKSLGRGFSPALINYGENPIKKPLYECFALYKEITSDESTTIHSFLGILNDIAFKFNYNRYSFDYIHEENDLNSDLLNVLSNFSQTEPFFSTSKKGDLIIYSMDNKDNFWFEYMETVLLALNISDPIFTFTDMEEFKALVKNDYKYQILLRFYLKEDSYVLTDNEEHLQEAVEFLSEIKQLIK